MKKNLFPAILLGLLILVQAVPVWGQTQKPVEIVQQQVEAYNARDLDAFMDFYTDDVKIYAYPDSLLHSGKEEMRKRYQKRFESSPDLHAEIVDRLTYGNYVIDHEKVTGFNGDGTVTAVAIYKVRGDKIEKVWFIQ